MIERLGKIIRAKFSRQDDLSRQLEIVKVFDLYRAQTKNLPGKAEPVSLKHKVLTVQTQSSVQTSELRFRESNVINEINQRLGKEVIKRVVYRF